MSAPRAGCFELTLAVKSTPTLRRFLLMRKLILSVLLTTVVMALSIATAAASSIGPTP